MSAAVDVLDMHTGGEPVRIIRAGLPPVTGATILEKRAYARARLDEWRRFLMFEPRGHYDMYGAWLVEPTLPGADLAVLFLHNEGYSTMCGHAVIALGRYAVDHGLVEKVEPVTRVGIECPCGLVEASVEVRDGRAGAVSFVSVPAFALALDHRTEVPGYGTVTCDVAYGGAFYALVSAPDIGLALGRQRVRDLVDAATAISAAVRDSLAIIHPEHADLGFLYGTILTDGQDGAGPVPSTNVCIFADAEVDRSPTGSGVTARLAAQAARGALGSGEVRRIASLTGAVFTGELAAETACGPHRAVRVRVGGKAHYMGEARFWREADDEIGRGFLLR